MESFRNWFLAEAVNVPLLTAMYKKKFGNDKDLQRHIDSASAADPTPSKKYTSWIFRELINGKIRLPEDTPVVQHNISLFDRSKPALKRLGKEINIDKYDRDQLWTVLGELEQSGASSGRQEAAFKKQDGSEKLYEDGEWLVVRLTKGSACPYYARGTKWCTSDENTASYYLEQGPIYVIYKGNKPYAQFHAPSGQLMDPQDVPMRAERIPQKLSDIARQVIIPSTPEEKVTIYEKFNIYDTVFSYSGYKWVTMNNRIFYLEDKDRKRVAKITLGENGMLRDVTDSKKQVMSDYFNRRTASKGEWEQIASEAESLKKDTDGYIMDFLTRSEDLKTIVHSFLAGNWSLSELSGEQRETLYRKRPELRPKGETDGGFVFVKELGDVIMLSPEHKPLLRMRVKDGQVSGTWHVHDKKPYSRPLADYLIRHNIEHIEHERHRGYGHMGLEDFTEEDKKRLLDRFPHLVDSMEYLHKNSKAEDFIDKIKNLDYSVDFKVFDEDSVTVNSSGVLTPHKMMQGNAFQKRNIDVGIVKAVKDKVRYPVGQEWEHSFWTLESELRKPEDNWNVIKEKFPFMKRSVYDIIKSDPRNEYANLHALRSSIGEPILEKAMSLLYEQVKKFDTDMFKAEMKNHTIYLTAKINDVKKHFTRGEGFKKLSDAYKQYLDSIDIDYDKLQSDIQAMPPQIDEELFMKYKDRHYGEGDHRIDWHRS